MNAERIRFLVKFLALTGMRRNEALATRIGDLVFAKSQVDVSCMWTSTESGKRIFGGLPRPVTYEMLP